MKIELPRNVLVACDFSDASERAVAWTAALQKRLGELEVHLFHLWAIKPMIAAAVPLPPAGPTEDDVRGIVTELTGLATRHGLKAEISFDVAADPGAAIVREAERLGCDLVVMGTHGRGGLSRAVLGSAADWVVRKAPCPVVVMRAA